MHGLVGSHIWMSYRINIIYAYIHIFKTSMCTRANAGFHAYRSPDLEEAP